MKPIPYFTRLMHIVLLLCCCFSASAKVEPWRISSTQTTPSAFHTGDTLGVYPLNTYLNGKQSIYRIRNYVSLHINNNTNLCLPDSFTCSVRVLIKRWNKDSGTLADKDTTLTVSYNKRAGTFYTEDNRWYMEDMYRLHVTITDVSCDSNITRLLVVEAAMEVTYYYVLTNTLLYTAPSGLSADSIANDSSYFIRVSWTGLDFSEEYDLEWVYVDDYTTTAGSYILPYTAPDFRNNASRVTIKSTHYDFHSVFDHGYVSFRVRATGKSGTNYMHRVNCKWSSTAHFLVHEIHETKKNWQYVATFAEEGKKKEVVSYMDGSLHNRQSVTQDNEQSMSIVGETIYDIEGRAGINILPVPAFNNSLKYFNDFNLNTASTPVPYSKSDFENLSSTTCHQEAPGQLSPNYGAGKYYSSSNPLASVAGNIHAYVPDAGGFPFVQVEYTPDNTGRIRRQSGVGANHTIESGHDTKYFYETPDKQELIRLFGTNVGDFTHYKKNTVIDANGQASISYLNSSGKVIATALAGPSPTNLSRIESYDSTNEVMTDLIAAQCINDTSSFSSYTFNVLENGQTYKLYYRMSVPKFDACLPSGNCFKGLYNLSISIEKDDQCGHQLFSGWPLIRKIDQNGNVLDTLCSSGSLVYNFEGDDSLNSYTFTDSFLVLTLAKGSYSIFRTISVDDDAANRYAELFVKQSTCSKTLADFETEYLAKVDSSLCHPTCASCLAKAGTYANFLENWINGLDTSIVKRSTIDTTDAIYYYAELIKGCNGLCDTISNSCENYLRTMMMDVSPSGQYFKLREENDQLYYDYAETFNIGRSFADPKVGLNDEMVMVRGELKRYDHLTPKEFLDNFDPAWAKKLVVLHPEYCKYQQCVLQNDSSQFSINFAAETDFDSALAKGYFNPTNLTAFKPTFTASAIIDPFFSRPSHIDSMMTDSLTMDLFKVRLGFDSTNVPLYKYIFTPTLTGVSYSPLYGGSVSAAYIIADSLDIRFSQTDKCRQNNQQIWALFKYYYLRYRKNIIDKWLKDSCTGTVPSGKRPLFKDFKEINDTLNDATIRSANDLDDNFTSLADKQCKAYAWSWMTKLKGCVWSNGSDSTALADSLVAVCKRGTDERNPMGATSVSSFWQKRSTPVNKNFHDVIMNWHSAKFHYGTCDEILIDFPGAYDHDYYANYDSSFSPLDYPEGAATGLRYDYCTCNYLNTLKATFDSDTSLCTQQGFASYVNRKYSWNFTDSQLIILMLSCQAAPAARSECDWPDTGITTNSHTTGNKYYDSVALTIKVPMALRCVNIRQCLNYSQVAAAVEVFVTHYGNPDTSWLLADLLGKYLNYHFGYNLTYDDYIDFINTYDTVFYKTYGYTVKDTSTYHNRPVFQDVLVNTDITCNCNKLLKGWAIWKAMKPRPTATFQEYVEQVLGFSIGFEPDDITILTLVDHCSGMGDTTDLQCMVVREACYSGGHFVKWGCEDCGEDCVNDTSYYIDYCLLDSLLDKGAKACTNLTPCEIISNLQAYDTLTTVAAETLMKTDYGHDFSVFDSKVYLDNDSTIMRVICNELTKDAQDFFELLNYLIKYDTFAVNEYITISKTPVWKASTLKERFNDTCLTCGKQSDPPATSPPSDKIYITHSNAVTTHRHQFTIFLGTDTINGCRVVFDSINVSTLDSIQAFFHLKPLGPMRVDNGQHFILRALLLNNDTITLTGISYCIPIAECCPPNIRGRLCNEPFFPTIVKDTVDCLTRQIALLKAKAYNAYLDYADSVRAVFVNHYKDSCMEHLASHERFIMKYPLRQHHYTLYYYDQAGNLVQTVPPAGVVMLNNTDVQQVIDSQASHTFVLEPAHTFRTNYQYNSLNQVVWQQTPDGGASKFWYDELGRLILSQNAKQAVIQDSQYAYSYTLYDKLGRIKEVGQLAKSALTTWNGLPLAYCSHKTTVSSGARTQITCTTYDVDKTAYTNGRFKQHFLRSRVSAVTYRRSYGDDIRHATYYDYDMHGNVQSLLQYNQSLGDLGQEYKQIDYNYDLISGKVNTVAYQYEQPDAFYHHYEYDAENRLTEVYTSRDSIIWDKDANYKYYLHGPLARTEIQPQRHLQGMDYVYTIQGWIKSVNSDQLKGMRDPGKDGVPSGTSSWASDVFGYSLSYFEGDYSAVSTGINAVNSPVARTTHSVLASNTHDLFNGNIRAMVTAISKFMGAANKPQGMAYQYDQLNRIIEANAFDNFDTTYNKWDSIGTPLLAYKNKFSYDANGNILTQLRRGAGATIPMDSLFYHYSGTDNKLLYVSDSISSGNYADDIDNQSSGNYDYDEIGNLIKDNQEQIAEIKWTVYGKISDIIRSEGSTKPDLSFEYGPDGNRVMKIVKPKNDDESWKYTYYVRDASGNVMAVYSRLSDKKVQYDVITFSQINDSLIQDQDSSAWRDFMADTNIAKPALIAAYINNILDNSLGISLLMSLNITDTWVTGHPLLFSSVLNQYSITELTDVTYTTYSSSFLDYLCFTYGISFIESCYAADRNGYLIDLYTNHNTEFMNLYNALLPAAAGWYTMVDYINDLLTKVDYDIASNLYSQGLCSVNNAYVVANPGLLTTIYSTFVGAGNFEANYRAYLNTLDPVTIAAMFETYDKSTLATKIFAAYPAGDPGFNWGAFFSDPDLYQTLLTVYPLWAGYSQDELHLYTMTQYFEWIKIHFGDSYYNELVSRFYIVSRHFVERYAVDEFDIYGSSRLGMVAEKFLIKGNAFDADYSFITGEFSSIENETNSTCMVHFNYKTLVRGYKQYELSNHLGNVLAVISDKRITLCASSVVSGYEADVISATDYSAFGAPLPGRSFSSNSYRYGFTGKEKDNEINVDGGDYDFGARIYDGRLGRWLAIDELLSLKASWSPFKAFNDNPCLFSDPDGKKEVITIIIKDADGKVLSMNQHYARTKDNRHIKDIVMTDGTLHSNGVYQVCNYYDFERITTIHLDKNGKPTNNTFETKILYGTLRATSFAKDPCGSTMDITNIYEQEGGLTPTSETPGPDSNPYKSKSLAETYDMDAILSAADVIATELDEAALKDDALMIAAFLNNIKGIMEETPVAEGIAKRVDNLCQDKSCRLNNPDTLRADIKKVDEGKINGAEHSPGGTNHGISGGEIEVDPKK